MEPKFNNGFRIFDSAPNPKREFNINCEFRMNQLFTLYFSFSIPRLVCTAGNLPLLWTCSHVWTLVTMAISKVQFFAQMDSVPSNAMRRKEAEAKKGESRDFFLLMIANDRHYLTFDFIYVFETILSFSPNTTFLIINDYIETLYYL